MTENRLVVTEIVGKVATVRLNRPEVRNAFNQAMIQQITEVFENLAHNTGIRVIVLRGNGKTFCAGADLEYMQQVAGFSPDENVADGMLLARMFEAIAMSTVPVVGIVHGASMGGANGILAACDIVLAENDTVFAFSEVKLGIVPAVISPFVLRKLQPGAARELMLTGRRFSAHEAVAAGLINYSLDSDSVETKLTEIIHEFYTASPQAVALCRKLIAGVSGNLYNDNLGQMTANYLAEARASAEGKEGLNAFLQKRKPGWTEQR
jgi:methylglutaconyl-CoA hydratase